MDEGEQRLHANIRYDDDGKEFRNSESIEYYWIPQSSSITEYRFCTGYYYGKNLVIEAINQ